MITDILVPLLGATFITETADRCAQVLSSCRATIQTQDPVYIQRQLHSKERVQRKKKLALIFTLVKPKLVIVYNNLHNSSGLKKPLNTR